MDQSSSLLSKSNIEIALVHPQIPPNTGNIARLCAAMEIPLHLVKPLGFNTDDKALRRAGLDYWPHVDLIYHECLSDFLEKYQNRNLYFLTTKSQKSYLDIQYQKGDILVFGSETKGLDEGLLKENWEKALTIPMTGEVRSLNLSSAVSIVCGEALRQVNS